ncbi:alanine racemase [Haliovirga abyssi]|uniref:Alanine racemase n=1 Tax=Haliovirga abyssi TaxID=2996794 RepID=A0AAU9DEK1_9FUSO|nr:alanine racemase [Haliovirga abyssi]BDU50777.1 alanine racemase [Haliovirga abyssi]
MRVWSDINLNNLIINLNLIKKLTSNNKKILGVIKANAYGHGAVEIARELSANGVSNFGVACIEEAEELVKNRIRGKILILGCTPLEEWDKAVSLGIQLTLSSYEEINYIEKKGLFPDIHVKIDTGMGRIGFSYEEAEKAIQYIKNKNIANIKGIFTHLSVADEDLEYTQKQVEIFKKIVDENKDIEYFHISNSAGILNVINEGNMVRPGIILYGIPVVKNRFSKEFKPVMSFKSKIIFLKEVKQDMPISYGKTYIAKKGEIIATVSAGYADGINRKLSNTGEVYLKGKRCKIIGRVCMDQMMIKIPKTLIGKVKVGDELEIFGENINIDEIAKISGTISYEILTNINNRVPRIYWKNGKIIRVNSLLGKEEI